MPFKWSRYTEYAKRAAAEAHGLRDSCCGDRCADPYDGACAELVRNAISRAYYAAFHAARAYVIRKDPTFTVTARANGLKSHEAVWKWFGNNRLPEIRKDGFLLKADRELADYESEAPNLHGRLDRILKLSERIVSKIQHM